MAKIRASVRAVAAAGMPIRLVGEVGTGRRTLATAVARLWRGTQDPPEVEIHGTDGIVAVLAAAGIGAGVPVTVMIRDAALLSEPDPLWLAAALARRSIRLVATDRAAAGAAPDLVPELAAHLEATTFVLPPLRDRVGDVQAWLDRFVAEAGVRTGRQGVMVAAGTREAVAAHGWPGNLLELASRVERAFIERDGSEILPADLGLFPQQGPPPILPLREAVERFHIEYVAAAVERTGGNRTAAAKLLGTDARTVFRWMERARIENG
jgi:DNA-binding NtrC family response regulator